MKEDILQNDKPLILENCLNDSRTCRYVLQGNRVVQLKDTNKFTWNIYSAFCQLLHEVFLPRGYPQSVSEDYTWYQIWDTLQACCSTFCGMLAVQAVLLGVGVGRENATPLAAALTWFTKDGVGMVSGITFAWLKGTNLDAQCKKWRLFADFINDVAFFIELSIAGLQDSAVILLCVSSALKAVVGVAGGATRAALTHHQATRGNTADVAAKDGSQETLVNLLTMSFGIWMINTRFIQQNVWMVTGLLMILHLYFNYRALKSLRLRKFNEERYLIALQHYVLYDYCATVEEVNTQESVILGFGTNSVTCTDHSICLGESLKGHNFNAHTLENTVEYYKPCNFVIFTNREVKQVHVGLKSEVSDDQVLSAYFHAFCVAVHPTYTVGKYPPRATISRLARLFEEKIPLSAVQEEFEIFAEKMSELGWNMRDHVLTVGQWRISAHPDKKEK